MSSSFRLLFSFISCFLFLSAAFSESFKPTNLKAPFIEQFIDISRWKTSQATKIVVDERTGAEGDAEPSKTEFKFNGNWSVELPTVFPGIDGDKGLTVLTPFAHHAISTQFPSVIYPKSKQFVVQYEVKLQNKLECGGAYLKLLTKRSEPYDPLTMDNNTPYTIMFGPDKCGTQSKIHFIFRHKNPITGVYEEKHLKSAPPVTVSELSTLYTLVVEPTNEFTIYVDQKKVLDGNLLTDFIPSVNPPKETEDVNDKKPRDWVDDAKIPDPTAVKPADWKDNEPMFIEDSDAKMPDGWLVDEPLYVNDPESLRPENWNDEDDGKWESSQIPNPRCNEAPGCGPWKRPTKKNPNYQGKWVAPLIDNPNYKGPWAPRKIPNPNFFEDNHPHNFEPMEGILFELWTITDKILFDNIFIGYSKEMADEFAQETWVIKHTIEKALQDASVEREDEAKAANEKEETGDWTLYFSQLYQQFLQIVNEIKEDPKSGAQNNASFLFAFAVTIVIGIFGISKLSGLGKKSSTTANDALAAKRKKLDLAADDKKKTAKAESADREDSPPSKEPVTPRRSTTLTKDD